MSDLLGQEHITSVIQNAAAADKLAHAYLFYGPRGTGKTTLSRLIAKLANCQTRQDDAKFKAKGEPCNICTRCTEIDAGRGIDVIEIDAASNRGIDEIRSLREGIRLAPTSYPYKVFIIDETHMLTKEAFNALLKTLEEPPAHAILILATTEYEKVPATITSRTQRFHFRKHSVENIAKKLKSIAVEEKLDVTDDALEFIAALAEGSFRDAESLLQQVCSLDAKVDLATVERNIGKVGFSRTSELAALILNKDLKGSLAYVKEISDGGFNVVDLTKELIHYLRRVLTLRFNPDLEAELCKELTAKELETLKAHVQLVNSSTDQLINLLKALLTAYSQMRYSPFAAIPLEVTLIEHLQ